MAIVLLLQLQNLNTLQPFFDVKRGIKGCKDKVNEKMPNSIKFYNKNMGTVEPHDWLAVMYDINISGKRWLGPTFFVHFTW